MFSLSSTSVSTHFSGLGIFLFVPSPLQPQASKSKNPPSAYRYSNMKCVHYFSSGLNPQWSLFKGGDLPK